MEDSKSIHGDAGVRTTQLNERNDTRQMLFLSHPHSRSREIRLQNLDWGWTEYKRNSSREEGGAVKSHIHSVCTCNFWVKGLKHILLAF